MITHEELIMIKDLFEEKSLSEVESKLLEKIKILIDFDDLQSEYDKKRKELSEKLQENSSK